MKNYIFLGPPGSGKGTQAKLLAEKIHAFYFGTGDLMREEAQKDTEFGQKFQAVWDQGEGALVSDEIVEKFVEAKLKGLDFKKSVVFDGFPRTIKQAQLLEKYIKSDDLVVLNIAVSKESLILRATTRQVCEKCGKIFFQADLSGIKQCDVCGGALEKRQEDAPEVVKKRIEVYESQTAPLIEYYKTKDVLMDIDGEPPIQEVTKEIESKING